MNNYESYNFIPMETIAKKLNVDMVNIKFDSIDYDIYSFEKIGFTHYALPKMKNKSFKLYYKKDKQENYKLVPLIIGTRLKELFELSLLSEYKNSKKIVPVYRFISKQNGEVMDCPIICFPSGALNMELVGILIK